VLVSSAAPWYLTRRWTARSRAAVARDQVELPGQRGEQRLQPVAGVVMASLEAGQQRIGFAQV